MGKYLPFAAGIGASGAVDRKTAARSKNIMVGQLYDQIEEYEPRAILGDITFEENAFTGKLIPIIEIEGVQTEDEET